MKSKPVSVPVREAPDRLISETVVLVVSHRMAPQLQRLLVLLRDHESIIEGRGGVRVFFHFTKASASVFSDAVMFGRRKQSKRA